MIKLSCNEALTNSDLEMVAVLLQYLVAKQIRPMNSQELVYQNSRQSCYPH